MQHERQALNRRKRFEHHKERESDGIGEERLLFGVGLILATDNWVWHTPSESLLGTDVPGLKRVQAHPGHDGREPATEVLDSIGTGTAQA